MLSSDNSNLDSKLNNKINNLLESKLIAKPNPHMDCLFFSDKTSIYHSINFKNVRYSRISYSSSNSYLNNKNNNNICLNSCSGSFFVSQDI